MAGLVLWSAITFGTVLSSVTRDARILMAIAAASVLFSMTLAAVYAIGVAAGEGWLQIPTMARTHGVLNALGFSFCGAGAWLLATRGRAPATP
jgi:hypothetical protein